jgi:hypothetical protein
VPGSFRSILQPLEFSLHRGRERGVTILRVNAFRRQHAKLLQHLILQKVIGISNTEFAKRCFRETPE